MSVQAQFRRIDGWADLNVLLDSTNIVIAGVNVSSRTNHTLIALNPSNGAVMWRQEARRVSCVALVDGESAVFTIAGDVLQKRAVGTGKVIWETPLAALPEQTTPAHPKPPTLAEYWGDVMSFVTTGQRAPRVTSFVSRGLGGTPNRYRYELLQTGKKVLLFREASENHGCTSYRCFTDWLILDKASGKLTASGGGELLAKDDRIAFIQNGHDVYGLTEKQVKFLGEYDPNFSHHWRPNREQFSCYGRSICERSVNGAATGVALFSNKGEIRFLQFPASEDYQWSCILLENHILHFTECVRYGVGKQLPPCFELYDLKGKLVQQSTAFQLITSTNEWRCDFTGVTRTGDVVCSFGSYPEHDRFIALTIPGLKYRLLPAPESGDEGLYLRTGATHDPRHLYHADSDFTVERMKHAKVSHELSLVARDTISRKVVWRYVEKVVIEKRKTPIGEE